MSAQNTPPVISKEKYVDYCMSATLAAMRKSSGHYPPVEYVKSGVRQVDVLLEHLGVRIEGTPPPEPAKWPPA